MAYQQYQYGAFKPEIKSLLRKRLNLKDKMRYYKKKIQQLESQLPEVEKQLEDFFKKIGRK